MLINGHRAKELDFKSFNVTAIYNLEGLPLPKDFDPYTWEGSPLTRHEGKRVLVTVLNTRDRVQAILAATSAIQDDRKEESSQYDEKSDPELRRKVASFLDTCLSRLTPEVRKYFYSDFGRKAMFYESEIAFRVLTRMAEKGITVIPIHDSFMVEEEHVEELRANMVRAFMEVFPNAPEPPTITDEN